MVMIMDMETGRRLEDEFGPFEDEVLGANWLPRPEVAAGLQPVESSRRRASVPPGDVEDFLRNMYLSQE